MVVLAKLKKQEKFKSMESDEVLETVVVEDSSTEVVDTKEKETITEATEETK